MEENENENGNENGNENEDEPIIVPSEYWYNPEEYAGAPVNTTQVLSPAASYGLYKIADRIQRALRRDQIPIWASSGTLLGAIRNHGIIPHDDDLDFAIFERDVGRATDALTAAGISWNMRNYPKVSHIQVLSGTMYDGAWHQSPPADIFVAEWMERRGFRDPGQAAMMQKLSQQQQTQPGEKEPSEVGAAEGEKEKAAADASLQVLFEKALREVPFGCSTIMVPDRGITDEFLRLEYGPDWATRTSCHGSWHECHVLADEQRDMSAMALPCYHPDDDEDGGGFSAKKKKKKKQEKQEKKEKKK